MTTSTPVIYPWQEHAWQQLVQQARQQHLPHAMLLKGVEGSGLSSFAIRLAHFLLCQKPVNNAPCGTCRDCHLLSAGSHPGYSNIQPEENKKTGVLSRSIVVDQIRDVIDTVNQTSLVAGRKVLLISPSDSLNQAAANALLKSLEEPPANTFFILVSQNPSRVLATIRSRCQQVDLPLPASGEASTWLENRLSDKTQATFLLALSANNPLLVLQWQENNEIASILDLGKQLQEILQGKISPLQLAALWQKNSVLDHVTWWWRWLSTDFKLATQQNPGAAVSTKAYRQLEFMQKLLAAKRQLESSANPNEQLLLESLLMDWRYYYAPDFRFVLMANK